MKIKNQHILGNQEDKKGIERLLRQAGKDKVIEGVIKGEDAEKELERRYHGIILYEDKTLGFYTKDDEHIFDNIKLHDETVLHDWSVSPLTRKELLERVRKDWRGKVRWAEHVIDKYIRWGGQTKPLVGLYCHNETASVRKIVKKYADKLKNAGVPLEERECMCRFNPDYIVNNKKEFPETIIIFPDYFPGDEERSCWENIHMATELWLPNKEFGIHVFPGYSKDAEELITIIGEKKNIIYLFDETIDNYLDVLIKEFTGKPK